MSNIIINSKNVHLNYAGHLITKIAVGDTQMDTKIRISFTKNSAISSVSAQYIEVYPGAQIQQGTNPNELEITDMLTGVTTTITATVKTNTQANEYSWEEWSSYPSIVYSPITIEATGNTFVVPKVILNAGDYIGSFKKLPNSSQPLPTTVYVHPDSTITTSGDTITFTDSVSGESVSYQAIPTSSGVVSIRNLFSQWTGVTSPVGDWGSVCNVTAQGYALQLTPVTFVAGDYANFNGPGGMNPFYFDPATTVEVVSNNLIRFTDPTASTSVRTAQAVPYADTAKYTYSNATWSGDTTSPLGNSARTLTCSATRTVNQISITINRRSASDNLLGEYSAWPSTKTFSINYDSRLEIYPVSNNFGWLIMVDEELKEEKQLVAIYVNDTDTYYSRATYTKLRIWNAQTGGTEYSNRRLTASGTYYLGLYYKETYTTGIMFYSNSGWTVDGNTSYAESFTVYNNAPITISSSGTFTFTDSNGTSHTCVPPSGKNLYMGINFADQHSINSYKGTTNYFWFYADKFLTWKDFAGDPYYQYFNGAYQQSLTVSTS